MRQQAVKQKLEEDVSAVFLVTPETGSLYCQTQIAFQVVECASPTLSGNWALK